MGVYDVLNEYPIYGGLRRFTAKNYGCLHTFLMAVYDVSPQVKCRGGEAAP